VRPYVASPKLRQAVSISGVDLQGHLLGVQAVVQASRNNSSSPPNRTSEFRQACLWSAFRQELYVGFMEHRPLRCEAPLLPFDDSAWDDWTWSLKAVSICADVVNCVFDGSRKTSESIDLLSTQVQAWQDKKPASFEPFLQSSGTKSVLPDCPMLATCHGKSQVDGRVGSLLIRCPSYGAAISSHVLSIDRRTQGTSQRWACQEASNERYGCTCNVPSICTRL